MDHYSQLSLKERRQINVFLDMNYPIGAIAQRLGRHRSTIYREIQRNQTARYYLPGKAHEQAQSRRLRQPRKVVVDSACYKYIMEKLKGGWSPEQIAGRMRSLSLGFRVCHETIYQYIYRHANKKIYCYLPLQRKRRRRRYQRYSGMKYGDMRRIANRPAEVALRKRLGDWEGDTIRFHQERQQSITTLAERVSRFIFLIKNIRSSSPCVMRGITTFMSALPEKRQRTLTFDQGSEFAHFHEVEANTFCKVFYADAHSPWQRGTNENTNKRLRRYLPKKMNIRKLTQRMLDDLAKNLNRTPRKCLDYLTPEEVFFKLRRKHCRT